MQEDCKSFMLPFIVYEKVKGKENTLLLLSLECRQRHRIIMSPNFHSFAYKISHPQLLSR